MLLGGQSVMALSYTARLAEIKRALKVSRTRAKALASKMTQANFPPIKAILGLSAGVSRGVSITGLTEMLSFASKVSMNFLMSLARGLMDARLIGLTLLGITKLEMFGGLPHMSKRPTECQGITGKTDKVS